MDDEIRLVVESKEIGPLGLMKLRRSKDEVDGWRSRMRDRTRIEEEGVEPRGSADDETDVRSVEEEISTGDEHFTGA